MSVGQPCIHCREGHIRPFQFSLDQAILRCDNAACDSLYEASPWEKVINRNIRQQIPRRSSDFGQYRLWGGSSSSSGVQSDIRSPLLSPAQSFGSVTDKEVELLLRKSYAPPKPTRLLRRSQEKCPTVTNPAKISPAKSQSPMLKTDSKCESFFELLSNLDLESPAHPVKGESPSLSSFDDVVNAELESWMKGFEYPESVHNDEVSDRLHSNSVEVNPTSAELNLLKPSEETVSDLCLPEEQRCIIPSQKSAFSQVSPKREKRALNSDASQYISTFEENEDITKILAESIQENFSNPDSLVCTFGSSGDSAKDDLSLLCDSQFLSPAASAASDDSGYNEEDANKLATVTLPQLQESHKLSSCSGSFESSDVEVNETAKCKSVATSPPFSLKNLTLSDLEVSAPQDIHFNIHPAMVTVEKSVTVNDPPGVESGSVEPNEDGGSLPVTQSTSDGELALTADDERDVEASNSVDFEKKIVENAPNLSSSCSVENTPNLSSSCSVDLESNGSHSMSGDESILRVDGGATSVINSSQTSVIHEPCEDMVSVASSHSGSTLPSDTVEDEESKALCSDQSSDALSLCSGGSINQCKGSNRGRGRGRGRGKRRGRGKGHITSGYKAGNVRSSDSNQEAGNDGQPRVRGSGRGHGRGPGRGRGRGSVNILPGSSEFQPSKRPRVAAEMLHRQTRQRTGSIEVQASTAPRERSCERTTAVDSSDGSMRRGLSSLLQGQRWQIAEQKNSEHNQNFTNLSFRSLLSGSLARDPWSVMELYLEELDIEVVVQGTRSSPEVPSEGTSSPGTCRTTEEATNNNLQQKHNEESEERIDVKSKELQIDKSGLCTPITDNNCVFKALDDAQVDVQSEKGRIESDIDYENPTSKEVKLERYVNDDRHTTHTSTSKNEELQVVSKDLVLLCNENTDGIHAVEKLCNSHSGSTSSLPFARQDNDKMDNTIEVSGDSQVLGFAQEHQQEQTKEGSQDAKSCVSEPKRDSSEDLGMNKEPHTVQSDVQPHSTHNYKVTRERICVSPNENVHSYREFTLSDASTKGLMDNSKKSEIKDRQSGFKMESQPLQLAPMPVKVSTLAQGFRENQEHNIGIVNTLSKVIADQEANSSVVTEVNLRENKQQHFTFKGSEHCISLPIEKQISDKKSSQIQLNTHQILFDIEGKHTKETTLDLTETDQSLGRQNESRAVQSPSHSKEFEVKIESESFMNLEKCDTMNSHHPNAVVGLPINHECYKTKEVDNSLQEVHVLDVLKNFVQDCNGLVVRSSNNEEQQLIKKNEDKGSNSVTGCCSSSTQDTGNELKKCNSPPSESSPNNASPYYLLLPPDSENVRSWMGHSEDSSLEEQAKKMPHMVDKDMQCTAALKKDKNAEATVKGSSSKYFGSLLQDIDFDDKFFQCPVQEHPSKTFDEHISSSLFFGETASCSPPQTSNPESPTCVKSAINQDLDEKYRDTCCLQQDENCPGSNIQALQYPVCKVFEHCAAVNAISTTSTQIYSEPVHTNVALATFPMKLPEACTWIPSCSSLSHARVEGIGPTMKSHISNVSCDNETTNLPYTQTFTSTAVFSAPKTPYPTPSYSTVCTTSVLPTVTSTIMTTVPSVMIDSISTCSSIPETKVDIIDNKSKRKKRHLSVKRHRRNVVRKEKNRNEDSQVISTDTSTRKCHCKVGNTIHDSTYKSQDYLGATCAATGETFRNIPSTLDRSGCDSKQREPSINLPSASVCSVVKTIDDRVDSVNVEAALHNVSGVSEVTEKAEKYTVRLAGTVPSGNVCIKQELKCFQSKIDCSDKYSDYKHANSQLPAVESMSVCDGEVNFIINAEKPGTSCDGDGDDDIPIISIDSEDEIQIIIPEKKCKYPKKTSGDVKRKTVTEECVSNSANSCIMQNSVGGNPEFINKIKSEGGAIGEISACDGDLKVKSTFPEEQMCHSNQRGQKRMVEDADESKVIKKQRIISDIDSSSDDSCSINGAPICGILDNSVVHDKKCFSPRVKDFVDFDENVRSSDAQENKNFYSVSKKSGLKQYHDVNTFGQFELGDTRENETSHILNQDDTCQGESLCHVFDSAIFCQDYKFGSTKSSPQHEIHPALKSDESSPGLLELDSTGTGFLSMIITSPESCIASPEPLQQELGSDSCNCHSVNSLEGIGSGHETSGIESRLTDGTEMGMSGSESEETVQPTSDFETETSVYDGSEEESESECEDSWESCAQKPVSWSNMKIQVTDSEGKVQVIPVVDSNYANNVKQLQCVKTSHSLIPENSQDTCRPDKTVNSPILPSKYLTSRSPCLPEMPICPAMTSSSLTSHAQFSKRAEERNLMANPQTRIIQPKTALSQGSAAEHQGQRSPVLPFVPPAEPTDVHLRTLSSQSWGVPLMTTSVSRITNSTNVMQTHFSQLEKQESVIDYKTPISPKLLTIVPPALVPSYSDIMPTNTVLTQAKTKTCLRGDTKSNSADLPRERIVAITSQTANGPVTRILRVIKPSTEQSDHLKEHHCRKSNTDKEKHIPVESLSEKIKETCLENKNMLKKVKMGSKGGFYMRPTSALKNALLEMRKKKSELDNKVQENAENSKYVELPDGEPICHPLILPSERKEKIRSIKSKKRRKKIREKIKRERKTRKFVKEKVQETVERSKDDCVVPEMVVVCVGGKLHLYRRDIADTCTQ